MAGGSYEAGLPAGKEGDIERSSEGNGREIEVDKEFGRIRTRFWSAIA